MAALDPVPVGTQLALLEQQQSVGEGLPSALDEATGEHFLAEHIDYRASAGPQRIAQVARDLEIIIGIIEIAEGREQVDRAIECAGADECPHIRFDEFDGEILGGCLLARALEIGPGAVDSGHRIAAARKFQRVAPYAAAEVENLRARRDSELLQRAIKFGAGVFDSLRSEHEWRELIPERIFLVP